MLSICKTALATSALNNSTFSCGKEKNIDNQASKSRFDKHVWGVLAELVMIMYVAISFTY